VRQVKKVCCNAGECKITKIKNKRQGTMTKGDRSAGGQRARGIYWRRPAVMISAGAGNRGGGQQWA